MNFPAIIADKKFGRALTGEQIEAFVRGAADKTVPDYQLSALLMAIRLNGMDARETADLTLAMARSRAHHALDVQRFAHRAGG